MSPSKVSPPSSTLQRFPHIHDDPASLPQSLDPFRITTATGFMPVRMGPTHLPEAFQPLMSLLDRMPVRKADGSPGLLATYELGPTVQAGFPDLTDEVDKLVTKDGAPDLFTVTAVFRDYSFLASAYLLEPCWESWNCSADKGYGFGRDVLPRAIAVPMYRCAQLYVFFFFFFFFFLLYSLDILPYATLSLISYDIF